MLYISLFSYCARSYKYSWPKDCNLCKTIFSPSFLSSLCCCCAPEGDNSAELRTRKNILDCSTGSTLAHDGRGWGRRRWCVCVCVGRGGSHLPIPLLVFFSVMPVAQPFGDFKQNVIYRSFMLDLGSSILLWHFEGQTYKHAYTLVSERAIREKDYT